MAWRYLAQRLNGEGAGEYIDLDLPLTGVQIEDVLSGDNALNANISPEYGRLVASDGRPLLEEWNTAIYAEADNVIRGGGILIRSAFDGPNWDMECVGFTGYANDMPYTAGGAHYEKTDAADIFRNIWNHIQGQPEGDIGLKVGGLKSKVLLGDKLRQVEFDTENGPVSFEAGPYKLNRYSNHNLGGDLAQLASVGGFDWHERHGWDSSDNIEHILDLAKPMGLKREDLRFTVGENVDVIPSIERDGDLYASDTLVLGAGEGSAQKYGQARRNTGRLRRVAVITDSSLRSSVNCNSRAEREVAFRNDIDDISSIVVRNHPHADSGAVQVGDEIYLDGELGWVELNTWVKVIRRTITPDDADSVTLEIMRTSRLTA